MDGLRRQGSLDKTWPTEKRYADKSWPTWESVRMYNWNKDAFTLCLSQSLSFFLLYPGVTLCGWQNIKTHSLPALRASRAYSCVYVAATGQFVGCQSVTRQFTDFFCEPDFRAPICHHKSLVSANLLTDSFYLVLGWTCAVIEMLNSLSLSFSLSLSLSLSLSALCIETTLCG